MQYDLLLRGGRVIDPAQGLDGNYDVAITNGKVAAVTPNIVPSSAKKVIDVSGKLVLPGLIDTHGHVFQHVTGRFGLDADLVGVHSGVTTLIDQGGPSCMTMPAFREYVVNAKKSRVLAFESAYLVGGMEGHYYASLYKPDCLDVDATVASAKANADIVEGYRWVSTLDSRTSELCQSLDGQRFDLGEGPMPPAHPNCRSTVVPVTKTFRELGIDLPELPEGTRASIGGQVPASLTYFEWLKTQPASFVEEALGPTRAAVFLKGGLSADEFGKLQLGRNFRPLTIEEMRELAPKVFERAGV